jgi:hypothetical protein
MMVTEKACWSVDTIMMLLVITSLDTLQFPHFSCNNIYFEDSLKVLSSEFYRAKRGLI